MESFKMRRYCLRYGVVMRTLCSNLPALVDNAGTGEVTRVQVLSVEELYILLATNIGYFKEGGSVKS